MQAYLVEINAKLIIRSDTDPSELPADIYAQLVEFIRTDDDIHSVVTVRVGVVIVYGHHYSKQ